LSSITIEFSWGDVDARLDVLNKLQQVEALPEEAVNLMSIVVANDG